ncbi:hypothetical protein H6G06_07705 [Anabaena sphaerica FACHB-251]|uniref:Transposase n=1 Tax=Anabaena sphaerica FACHB-251 TaxID=2692883 RepID=A0A927A1F3_9NOST|nr:hypothetical protein [Anabaena sphaerica]MBD2293375.1 hypothetical protein [Anabaena sphaerica FACHB-251]
MFKDCKTGGYNLEGFQASPDRLVRIILLIALAMTSAWLQGKKLNLKDNNLMFVVLVKIKELEEDIVIFG